MDIRELLGNILFWVKGTCYQKWALFFDIFADDGYVDAQNIIKIIGDALHIFKENFAVTKANCNKMNTALDGKISFSEF